MCCFSLYILGVGVVTTVKIVRFWGGEGRVHEMKHKQVKHEAVIGWSSCLTSETLNSGNDIVPKKKRGYDLVVVVHSCSSVVSTRKWKILFYRNVMSTVYMYLVTVFHHVLIIIGQTNYRSIIACVFWVLVALHWFCREVRLFLLAL